MGQEGVDDAEEVLSRLMADGTFDELKQAVLDHLRQNVSWLPLRAGLVK